MALIKRCKVCRSEGKKYFAVDCGHKEAVWCVKYRVGKKQVFKTVGRVKRDAERFLVAIKSEINTGGSVTKVTPILFSDLAGQWFDNKIIPDRKPATQSNYRNALKHHLLPFLGSTLVTQITPLKIETLKVDLRKKLGPKSVNNILKILGSILRYGRVIKCMKENPMEGIELFRVPRRESAFLTPLEAQRLLRHSNEPYRTLFLIAVCTGMRSGEILSLKWSDVDWVRQLIYVRRSLCWLHKDVNIKDGERWTFTDPKSEKSNRAVFMIPLVADAIKQHKLTCPESKYDLVFCTKTGAPIRPSNIINREFHPALKRAGLPIVRFHDLRHSCASWMLGAGENVSFVSKHLGHSSINVTVDIYHHVMPQELQEVSDRMQKRMLSISDTTRIPDPLQVELSP